MDELVIEDKKYISSKRAAQFSGYAKDYIGQLCREGRVPARLVGRNWYVLESALTDHRFKAPEKAEKSPENIRIESVVGMSSGWESPRYEAISAKEIPSLKRLEHVETEREVKKEAPEAPVHLHEAWQAWFDHIASQPPPMIKKEEAKEAVVEETFDKKTNEILEKSDTKEEENNVPIRAIHRNNSRHIESGHEKTTNEGVARSSEHVDSKEDRIAVTHSGRSGAGTYLPLLPFQLAGATFALITAIFAGLSTGYFDDSIASLRPVNLVAGVLMYQK